MQQNALPPSSPRFSSTAAPVGTGAGAACPPPTAAAVEVVAHLARADAGQRFGLCVPGTAEGILTGVAVVYLARAVHAEPALYVTRACQPRLGEAVVEVGEDAALARRVLSGFRRATSAADAKRVLYACQSDEPSRAQAVFAYLRYGFSVRERLWNHRAAPQAVPVFDLARTVGNECERARQFVRFHRMEGGVYHARFEPNANVVPLVMGHFSERFNTQPFVIHDPRHRIAGFWDGHACQLVEADGPVWGPADDAGDDRYYQALWKRFYDSVAVEARLNPELRRQFMPKRFWKNLPEMDPSLDEAQNGRTMPASPGARHTKGVPARPDRDALV